MKILSRGNTVMRTDDRVGFRMRRTSVSALVFVGILVMVGSIVLLIHSVDRSSQKAQAKAQLSSVEVQQLRDLLATRHDERIQEQVSTQKQLDAQARVLCATISDFATRAHTPETKKTLAQAALELHCSRF